MITMGMPSGGTPGQQGPIAFEPPTVGGVGDPAVFPPVNDNGIAQGLVIGAPAGNEGADVVVTPPVDEGDDVVIPPAGTVVRTPQIPVQGEFNHTDKNKTS